MKTCCRCGEEKPTSEFFARAIARDGLSHACKACLRERRRENRALSPEEKRARVDALRTADSKSCGKCGETKSRSEFAVRKRSRDGMSPWCKACMRSYSREHHMANKAKRAEQTKAWHLANKASRNAKAREWRAQNKEREAQARRHWLEANPGYMREYMRKRRARLVGATVLPVDLDVLWTGTCGICAENMDRDLAWPDPLSKSVDHIVPIARGGAHAQWNLQWAHYICNARKGASMPSEVA